MALDVLTEVKGGTSRTDLSDEEMKLSFICFFLIVHHCPSVTPTFRRCRYVHLLVQLLHDVDVVCRSWYLHSCSYDSSYRKNIADNGHCTDIYLMLT